MIDQFKAKSLMLCLWLLIVELIINIVAWLETLVKSKVKISRCSCFLGTKEAMDAPSTILLLEAIFSSVELELSSKTFVVFGSIASCSFDWYHFL